MKSASKAILLALCAVLLVASTVFGTLAYLTSTDEVTNTFTVGNVKITLDEAKVNTDGTAVEDAARVKANEYHLLPGHKYVKDPTIHIDAKSENAYYRMMVTVTFQNGLTDAELATSLDTIFTGHDSTKWIREAKTVSSDAKTITYEYRYYTTVAGDQSGTKDLEPLFTAIEVPGTMTNESIATLNEMKINIVAHAIQADGFATADAAWAQWN